MSRISMPTQFIWREDQEQCPPPSSVCAPRYPAPTHEACRRCLSTSRRKAVRTSGSHVVTVRTEATDTVMKDLSRNGMRGYVTLRLWS